MQSIVLLLWLALCSEQDVRQRQISNLLTLGVAACALAWLFATGHSWIGAEASDAGWALAIVMLLTLPGYMLGRFGAGDVKLMAMAGSFLPPHYALWAVFFSLIWGGLCGFRSEPRGIGNGMTPFQTVPGT